jgi:sugar/nucleoside kinase (ribokinase family)
VKKVAVIGTLVWDRIWHPTGSGERPVEQWGGIAYSLAAFAAACPPDWVVVPIVRVGADLADSATNFLRSLPDVQINDGITIVDEPNNRVELRYHDDVDRSERLTGGVSGWSRGELAPRLRGVDAVYLNFISGFEIDLASAESLRDLDIPLYADLHSLFLGPPGDGARAPRRLADLHRWVGAFDIVQVNESELLLTGEVGAPPDPLLTHLIDYGPELALVTRGRRGAGFARRSEGLPAINSDRPRAAEWRAHLSRTAGDRLTGEIPAASGMLTGDPTGCGDVWGSVAFAGLLQRLPLEEALRRANIAAAAKINVTRIDRLFGAIGDALAVTQHAL